MNYIESLFNLKGKVAVIIGGTGELCGHIATGLAKAGAEVVLAGRDASKADDKLKAISDAGGKGYFVSTDLTEKNSLENLLESVIGNSGRVDILINGAGVNSPTPIFDVAMDELEHIFKVNFAATFQACQIFAKYFVDEGIPGSIINLGSISGLSPLSRVFTYSASKAAIHNLSKNLARGWADKDIRVNTLVPGFFPAEQNRKVLDESRVLEILRQTPMSRFGNPEELIGAVLLMASNQAGGFITGTEMIVDGGFNAMSI